MREQITENAEIRKKLEEVTQRYHVLFEITNDAIFLIDLDGVHFKVNNRAAKMLGYSVEELLTLSYREIVLEAELDDAEMNLAAMLKGEVLSVYERTFKKKDGSPLPVEINVALIRDNNGNPLHFQSIVRDISERKILEASFNESEERYRLIADYVKDVIAIIDLQYNITYVSPAVEQITGYSVQEAQTINMSALLIPQSVLKVQNALREALILEEKVGPDGYEAPSLEIGLYHKNGSIIWAIIQN